MPGQSISMVRAKCYLIMQGLERSLADNLIRNYQVEDPKFLTTEETDRALNRLRDDMEESEWELEDVRTDDLLVYLDLGDLLSLLNRHKSRVLNAKRSDIEAATKIIESQHVLAIRRRVMHPIRPLEADDLSTLMSVALSIPQEAPSLIWQPLIEGYRLAQRPEGVLDVIIPPFWAEEPKILHNLPAAEFDDTGFIGRSSERQKLKNLLESDHSVITVVGAGGIGKTALALRVCHDILEDPESNLERVVWVSLKTQYLTADGIRAINDSVDTVDALVDRLMYAINIPMNTDPELIWDRVLEQMKANKILLVIDNLETLGSEIRELAVNIPRDSKLLLTSRIGLGEVELRYEMPNLSGKDARSLMRNLGVAYNYMSIRKLDEDILNRYCERLHYNPLLIKWFVQAVGKGAMPEEVLSNEDMGQALSFCWENVYTRLSNLAISIISTLLAARRSLSQAQLQELLETGHLPFVEALQELHQSNIVERSVERDSRAVYQIGSLVLDYLSRYHPPSDVVVIKTRERLRKWQNEQDRSAVQRNTYRYDRYAIHTDSNDDRIAAPHLRNALNIARSDSMASHKSLQRAQELTPQWWEVYRVKARVLEIEGRPIYEIEQAFEESINCKDTDVNRFHYAVYLMKMGEFERALEHIEKAFNHEEAHVSPLRSIKGLVLLRGGRIQEALVELEYAWIYGDDSVPMNIKRGRGTQFADGLRRRVEQLYNLGNAGDAKEVALKGVGVAEETAVDCGWDRTLAKVGVQLLSEVMAQPYTPNSPRSLFIQKASAWDANDAFRDACREHPRIQDLIRSNADLYSAMPNFSRVYLKPDHEQIYTGVVKVIMPDFGFITTDLLGDVHMSRSSLVRPSTWNDLRIGQKVVFAVRNEDRGPHALDLETVLEPNFGNTNSG